MNHRLQLSPLSHGAFHTSTHLGVGPEPSAIREEIRFFRSWLVYDSDLEASRTHGSINWNAVLGLCVVASVSAGGWYAIEVLLRHITR
jgi:hypothetical protein